MSGKRPSVYLTDKSLNFLDGRSESLSGSINQAIDRYDQILKQTDMPKFTESEINTMLNAISGTLYEPAEMIAGFWQGIQDDLVDDLTGEVDPADMALVEKLKTLTYLQEVALLERLEQRSKRSASKTGS